MSEAARHRWYLLAIFTPILATVLYILPWCTACGSLNVAPRDADGNSVACPSGDKPPHLRAAEELRSRQDDAAAEIHDLIAEWRRRNPR